MYKENHQFKATPFTYDTNPNFFFLSQHYQTPLAVLISGLDKGVKLHAVFGKDGVGKTIFINYVYKLIKHACTATLLNKRIRTASTLLQLALTGFGQKAERVDKLGLFKQLRTFLEIEFEKNHEQPSLLIIDDADKMTPEAFGVINSLLNLSNKNNPLLQLILVGNSDLEEILHNCLKQTISENTDILWHHLKPLTIQDTKNYIHHRLKIVGVTDETLFNEQVCAEIYEHSKGIPRNIDTLCHQVLQIGIIRQTHIFSSAQLHEIADNEKPRINSSLAVPDDATPVSFRFFKEGLITAVIVAGIGIAFFIENHFLTVPEEPQLVVPSQAEKKPNIKPELVATASTSDSSGIKTKDLLNGTSRKVGLSNRLDNNIQRASESPKKSAIDMQVVQSLAIAERQLSESKLLTPKQDNAYETYTAILSTNPNEQRAISGLQRIAKRYLTLATKRLNQGELLSSETLISRGLEIAPDHRKLVALSKQVEHQYKIQEQERKIQTLVKQGGHHVIALKLISPPGDNAYQSYLDVFAIDKTNQLAEQGMKKIQWLLESQIVEVRNNKEYGSAMEIVKLILTTPSKEIHLEDLLATAYETEKMVTDKIVTLLNRADQQLESKQLIHPSGNNATETYRIILKINHANKDAKRGLENIVRQYRISAESALAGGKTKQALIYANKAIKVFPDNLKLRELQNKISNSLSKQSNRVMTKNIALKHKRSESNKELRLFGNF